MSLLRSCGAVGSQGVGLPRHSKWRPGLRGGVCQRGHGRGVTAGARHRWAAARPAWRLGREQFLLDLYTEYALLLQFPLGTPGSLHSAVVYDMAMQSLMHAYMNLTCLQSTARSAAACRNFGQVECRDVCFPAGYP